MQGERQKISSSSVRVRRNGRTEQEDRYDNIKGKQTGFGGIT